MKIRTRRIAFASAGLIALVCCRPSAVTSKAGKDEDAARPPSAAAPDFVQIDSETTPKEKFYLSFGRKVITALAARDYALFYDYLSAHARARMSLNQFDHEEDDAKFEAREKSPRKLVALPEFLALCALMEQRFGTPFRPMDLHVNSTEPHLLAGRPKEPLDQVDILFAIGNIPPEVPVAARRASLRGQIALKQSATQVAAAAKDANQTSSEVYRHSIPYLIVKLVLVEEDSRLRVGYFEFLPSSITD